MRSIGRNPIALWLAFLLAHLWIGWLNLHAPGLPLGDVSIVYKFWVDQIAEHGFWVGIQSSWVYPILAIFPMLAAAALGPDWYSSVWLSMILLLDLGAFAVLIGFGRRAKRATAAWWWIGFMVLLGPIAMGRIDAVTVAVAVMGVSLIAARPWLATLLLTIATWIKVWPVALVTAILVSIKGRLNTLAIAVGFSLAVLVVALSFGAGSNVFSFISQQTNRGLQVEAPISTFWMWRAFSGAAGNYVYYDNEILTWQVTGDGVGLVGSLMTPLMLLAVIAVILLAVIALRHGGRPEHVLAVLSLALACCLLAFNKVGSPQFVSWLAVPIILGLSTRNDEDRGWFTVPAAISAAIAALTQLFYPYWYGSLLSLNPLMLGVLTLRNGLYLVLLGWAIHELVNLRQDSELAGFFDLEEDPVLDRTLS
ncbi:MAG: DUF2029 domain-containing protein [Cryobacterium sp.]|nr:DUF2029 domain-containing protein [Cryobacterium sp.]MBX3116857.1 DUF2029 domain-containing protein [Cryobacterium sp.]MCO5293650.1 DUF2029 domain-containing protein [Homoserinimonas sp.]MCW5944409.1 DUF2029 domain-containing protein [Cryobacterium sp.]